MLLTIFIIGLLTSVLGLIMFFSAIFIVSDNAQPWLAIPGMILMYIGSPVFVITGILLLIRLAFPALGQ